MSFILCDEIDSGKSAFCMGLVRRLVASGARISGWVMPAHMEDGEKIGHDLVAIDGGKIETPIPLTRQAKFEGSFQFMKYHFSAAAFERAARLGYRGGIFIMDEIGPLELVEQKGFHEPMMRILESPRPVLCVVRKGLEERLIARFPNRPFAVYDLLKKDALSRACMTRCGG